MWTDKNTAIAMQKIGLGCKKVLETSPLLVKLLIHLLFMKTASFICCSEPYMLWLKTTFCLIYLSFYVFSPLNFSFSSGSRTIIIIRFFRLRRQYKLMFWYQNVYLGLMGSNDTCIYSGWKIGMHPLFPHKLVERQYMNGFCSGIRMKTFLVYFWIQYGMFV